MMKGKPLLLATAGLIALVPGSVFAQTQPDTGTSSTPAASTGEQVGTIIVTARKRAENVLDVPVAITAFTGEDLAARNIKTTSDLANFTPSLTTDTASAGGARVDRSTQLFIIRGMNPSTSLNPTTSVFLNGVPVGASDFLQNLDDVDHVEVLKGPQAAYFGRETFAGAINAVAKSAGNEFTGNISLESATRNTQTLSGSVTVPIVKDLLSIRIGGYYDNHDGSYVNHYNPTETLGDQTTKAGHVAVTFKPLDGLTIKAFGMIFEDNDGPAATGLLLGSGFALPAAFNQSNCTVNATPWFCGTLPHLSSASPAVVDTITSGQKAFFANPGGLLSKSETIDHFGLKRRGDHADLSAEYDIPNTGVTLSYLGGFNRDNYSSVSDLANIDGTVGGQYPPSFLYPAGYTGFPFLVESRNHDYSHEVRAATDPNKRFHALIGASYLDVYHEAINYSLGGTPGPAPKGAPSISKTAGFFFSLSYRIFDSLTLTAEGRYQVDKEIAEDISRTVVAKGKTHDFLPRVSLQYTFAPGVMAYATYSKGINPGVFNTQYNTIPTGSQQELTSAGAAGGLIVKPERITNYEVGLKGRFLDGRATLSADIYYDRWNNQLNQNEFLFAANDPVNPYNVVGYSQYNPANHSVFVYSYTDNSAASTAKGVEAEATLIPFRYLTVNLSGAFNDTKYRRFNCTSCAPYPTTYPGFDASGNRLANSPKYSATVGAEYQHPLDAMGATSFFGRVDYIYRSGEYIDAANTAKTQPTNIVNLRAGIDWKHFGIEIFGDNVFNNKSYTTGFQNYNFAGFFTPAVMVGLPALVTGGVRVHMNF